MGNNDNKRGGSINIRSIISIICVLVLIPGVLFLSWIYSSKSIYITSIVVIFLSMIPFFLSFEHRAPQARELVVLAVLCAIAVVARSAFIWFPAFKPMTALFIIIGIAFGAEAGFLSGAVTALVSNFVFGQGVWTPWQMFAYGMAGFIAGVLYHFGLISKKRLPLSIFGAVLVIVIVGPLLDTCSLFTEMADVTAENALVVYVAGFPLNLIHAAATFLTLFFLSGPIFSELDRLKMKYGLLGDH